MRSRRAPRQLSSSLEELASELAPATTLARVQRAWASTVGTAIAEAGRPTAERDGVLTVVCADAVWAAELDLMATTLIERLNGALGEPVLTRVRCRVG